MGMMSSKKEKEKWVVNEFFPRYNKIKGSDYSLKEKGEKPDFIITDNKGKSLGLEVTEYTGYPRTKAGEQKVKEYQFEDIMEKKLSYYKNFHFSFYVPSFPTKGRDMECLCEKLTREIENSMSKGAREAGFDNVVILFAKDNYCADGPKISFSSSPEGFDSKSTQEIKNDLVEGLYELMKKKVNDAQKYKNKEENILVIYENDYDSALVTEQMGEVIKLLRENFKKEKMSHPFKEIWVLDDSVEIYQVY